MPPLPRPLASPPRLQGRDEVAPRAVHWPVRVDDASSVVNTLWAQWTLKESDRDGVRYTYEGRWVSRPGRVLEEDTTSPAKIAGHGEGEVLFTRRGELLRHSFSWTREVTVSFPATTITQQQSFIGTLERR